METTDQHTHSERDIEYTFLSLELLQPPELGIRVDTLRKIDELAESVVVNGVLEPLIVRPSKEVGRYEVVCGLRRFLAAEKAGLKTVPCIVKEIADREAMEAMLVENIEREDLSDYERGRWLKLIIEKFPDTYGNMDEFARRFGFVTHAQVSRLISHFEFMEELKKKLPTMFVPHGTSIPEGITREIRRAPSECQTKLVEYVVKHERHGKDVAGIVNVLLETPEDLREKVLTVLIEKDLNARETTELLKVLSAHKVIVKAEEKLEKKKPPGGTSKKGLATQAETEQAVNMPETQAPPKHEEAKPFKPSLDQLRSIAEEIKAKRLEQKYDKAGQIYIFLSNYYPQQLIDAFTDRVKLEGLTEEKAVAMMKEIVAEMCDRLTNYGRKHEVLDEIFETVVKWR
ncbi:MAG: ParB/RepB/Spo0J family partition protein [Candidatus Bathyarchaeia archaeon]